MEQRQLLTATAFGISGASAIDEAANYVLSLASAGPGASTVDHWTIDWGDGNTQTVPGSPASVTHAYADGPRDHTILATVTNADGTFPARNGPALNDADLDTTFGSPGTGKISASSIGYTAVAPLAGGKFLVAGTRYTGSTSGRWDDFWLGRFNADGSPDTSFGPNGDGTTTADFAGRDDFATALAVQSDGRIVVGGRSLNSNGSLGDFALARFNADGTLDDGTGNDSTPNDVFGTAGTVRRHTGSYTIDYLSSLAIQSDGKIVAGGSSELGGFSRYHFAIARFNPNGSVDTSFAGTGAGSTQTDFPDSFDIDHGYALAIQTDGKIILAGDSGGAQGAGNFAAARYNPDGSLDGSFASGGLFVSTSVSIGGAFAVALQANGGIILGGKKQLVSGGFSDWGLMRLDSTGAVDMSFGGQGLGVVTTALNLSSGNIAARALTVLPDGRILAGGTAYPGGNVDFGLARYNANGTLDTSFGDGGKVVTDFDNVANWVGDSYHGGGGGMAVMPNGNVILVGGDGASSYMARYLGVTPPKSIHVNNVAPTLALGGAAGADEGSAFSLSLSSSDPGSDTITQWVINWGDGSPAQTVTGNPSSVTHTYADNGTYSVSATATDEDGTYTAPSRTVQIANVAPTVTLSGAAGSNEGADYALTLARTDPGNDSVREWIVNWGDGSAAQTVSAAAALSPVLHRFADNGSYTISVSVTDEDGTFSGGTKAVAVTNVAPTLTTGGSNSVAEGSSYSLALSSSDPGADTISQWVINWGDGSPAQTVTGNPSSVAHTYADNGTFNVSASATDEDGTYAVSPNKSVQVTNVAPTVTLTGPSSLMQNSTYGLTISTSDPGNDSVYQWVVNWGDGTAPTSFPMATPSAFHPYLSMGNFVITVTANDEDGSYVTTKPVVVTEPDRALGRPASASAYDTSTQYDYRAFSAVDGNANTRWSAAGGGTQWLKVDLGTTYNLSKVRLNWEGAYASAYKIQVSEDELNWRDAASVTNGDGGVDELTASPNGAGLSGNGRYVRVLCTTAPYGNYSLWSFEVFGSADLARNRPSSASVYDTSTQYDYRALSATDGNSSSRWSAAGGGTQWLRVDLGGAYRLGEVKLNWEGAYASGYKIQVSNDAQTWRDAYATTAGDGGIDDVTTASGLAGAGRYVQVLCTSAPYGNYSLWDFEVYGGSDLAFKAAASASAYDTNPQVDYRASSAFDGNANTRWSAAGGGTQWLRADLGASFKVSRVKLNWEGAYGSAYRIQVSDDQVNWRDATSVTNGDGGLDDLYTTNNANSTGRYVQVLMTSAPYGNYSLWSFEVIAG